jgi:hypothetical protein
MPYLKLYKNNFLSINFFFIKTNIGIVQSGQINKTNYTIFYKLLLVHTN